VKKEADMAHSKYDVKHPDLKNSELHHPLKNQPGEKGDAQHADGEGDGAVSPDIAKTIEEQKDGSAMAAAFKDAVSDDDDAKD